MKTTLERLIRLLDYRFDRPELLDQALTHRSASASNNERLEFLGDALLGFVIAETLFRQHEHADEGQLSRLRAGLVKKESLAMLARTLELGDHLHLGLGELRSGGYARDSILADAMEAVLAAVYLDGGIEAAYKLILRLYKEHLQGLTIEHNLKDPKTRLQELLQSRGASLPEYEILEIWGNQHEQLFRVSCRVIDCSSSTEGSGNGRRKAEQQAAQLMLELLASA